MYTETVQALSIILEGYKITLKNLMLIVNVHVLIYPKTHTDWELLVTWWIGTFVLVVVGVGLW